ncbi:MAG: CPXCG motif-containing cysteine-rich protein [Planctomycetaceae bacterium]|nr:CPXCG motif-containing cysteine-rich protein [Planctomycetaceae bacterium]
MVEAEYVCQSCGEVIVIPVDTSVGSEQEYVEDCPVCCHPNVITVNIESDGYMSVRSELES